MLSTMASFGAGRDSPSPLPLALTLSPMDNHSLSMHQSPFRNPHHSFLHLHPSDTYPEHLRRLALARLPPPRRPTSGTNPKPFTSFCIKDILGGEADRDEDSNSSGSSRPQDMTTASSFNLLSPRSSSGTTGGGKVRASSRSPTLLASSKTCKTSPRMPASAMGGVNSARIVRPWAPSPSSPDTEISSDDGVDTYQDSALENEDEDDEEISVDDDEPVVRGRASKGDKSGVSPLDALMAMTSKTFEGLDAPDSADARRRDQAAMFGKHAPPKKRRKSRTAFSNQQIYELEKRFLYQKYLTPADRDDIAHSLGLTNAQVITWFQNRRAKLKRDLEELKNDVTAARKNPVHKNVIGTVAEMQLRRVHEQVLQKAAAEARRADRERNRGESVSSPPSSPSSSSAAAPNSCCPSPSPLPLVSGPGMLSPAGSCQSNTTCSSMNDVCSLVASNNNNNNHNFNKQSDEDEQGDVSASSSGGGVEEESGVEGVNSCMERESCGGSPGHRSRDDVSPASSPLDLHTSRPPAQDEQDSHQNELSEVDMDTSDEPENLSLKSHKS